MRAYSRFYSLCQLWIFFIRPQFKKPDIKMRNLTAAVFVRSKLKCSRRGFGVGERIFCSNRARARLKLIASKSGESSFRRFGERVMLWLLA